MKLTYFDIRDIFRTPRLALSGKKIWVHSLGLAIGWGIYTILTYLALILNGQAVTEIWNTFHFFPCLFSTTLPVAWYAYLISGIGIVLWVVMFLEASLAVSRITYKQLKGDEFFSSGDSVNYIKKHGLAVIMGPISILLIIAFFVICAIVAAWISKWPVLDICILGLPYLLYFIVSTFVVYSAAVFVVSFVLAPSIVGTAEEDTMETVFQSYSTLWSQPWRLISYEAIVVGLSGIATFIYGWVIILGYKFFNYVFGAPWLMDGKMARIIEQASSYLYGANSPLTPYISKFFYYANNVSKGITKPLFLTTTDVITIILITIALFAIAASVIAFFFSNITAGQSIIYIILRKKKDDENLIERKDEDELAEEEKNKKEEEGITPESPSGTEENSEVKPEETK